MKTMNNDIVTITGNAITREQGLLKTIVYYYDYIKTQPLKNCAGGMEPPPKEDVIRT